MKIFSVFVFSFALVAVATLSFAQVPTSPGTSADAQAQQAFAFAQAQSMMMTNQAQFQNMIASQAAMLNSVGAQTMFLSMASSLQMQVMARQGAISAASMNAMRHALELQKQLQVRATILRMRSQGVENAADMQQAIQVASLDSAQVPRRYAMLHAVAAQASGQTTSSQTAPSQTADKPSADAVSPSVEPPPMMIRPTFGNIMNVDKPTISLPSGKVSAGSKVSLRSDTHYATLYYTTNGWTPTTQSAKYTGPITINTNTHLEVIAVGPNFVRSAVEHADYQVSGSPSPVLESTLTVPEDGTLRAGTPVRVAFAGKDIDSETAAVGDEITVELDEQIKLGETVLAPKGAAVNAALTFADPARGGAPGDLVFEIHSVEVAGKHVPLFGGETLEGAKGGLGGGKNTKIKPGMTAMAFVAADTLVK